jgi:hypothetical protein
MVRLKTVQSAPDSFTGKEIMSMAVWRAGLDLDRAVLDRISVLEEQPRTIPDAGCTDVLMVDVLMVDVLMVDVLMVDVLMVDVLMYEELMYDVLIWFYS